MAGGVDGCAAAITNGKDLCRRLVGGRIIPVLGLVGIDVPAVVGSAGVVAKKIEEILPGGWAPRQQLVGY